MEEKVKNIPDFSHLERRKVPEEFTWNAAAEKTVACYREVIHDHHRF